MPYLDGRAHIFECADGHKWESGDFQHHPVRDYRTQRCAHRCGKPCVKMTCPVNCTGRNYAHERKNRKGEPP